MWMQQVKSSNTFVLCSWPDMRLQQSCRQFLDDLIRNKQEATEDLTDEEYIDMWENEEERRSANTTVGRSPYSRVFKKVFEEAKHTVDSEEDGDEYNRNVYHCPDVPIVLMNNYMGIYPLWSGAFLGDLRKYASDKDNTSHISDSIKTRDTNCHVEAWFAINLLVRPVRPKKSVVFAEESWAKREEPAPQKAERSKYYSIPKKEPKPKTKATPSKKDDTTDSNLPKDRKFCDLTVSKQVEFLWTCPETEIVVAVFKLAYTLRHADFMTLRPHEFLNGETVQKAKAESQRLENLCRELGCPENMVQQWTATRFNNCGDGNLGKRKENSEAIKRYNKQVPEEEGINEEMVESRLSVVGQGSGEESLIWPWEVHRTESTNILTKKIIFDVKDAAARREDPYS
ncbi:hypothetical protein ROHU_011936 [Labeo rohita]|uniref:Uncharacterized protein n=1 Tax=Labeo rohita TaxID=84645 RepID=A0A498LH69_LABRO|nr:hypothetical protein ROHU_011936 [Labeo rohita]